MEKITFIVLHHRNVKIKAIEKLPGGKYKLIDGDVVGPDEIKEIINEKK